MKALVPALLVILQACAPSQGARLATLNEDSAANAAVVSELVSYAGAGLDFEGYASYPTDGVDLVPVLVLPDWHGQTPLSQDMTRKLAEHGYFAFSVDLFGKGVHPNEAEAPQNAVTYLQNRALMRERLSYALEKLRSYPMVKQTEVYALGYSFGGPVAIELAEANTIVKKTAVLWGALATPNSIAAPTESSFLFIQGAKDPFAPPASVTALTESMRSQSITVETVLYPNGYHAFGHTYVGDQSQAGLKYDPELAADSWTRVFAYFSDASSK